MLLFIRVRCKMKYYELMVPTTFLYTRSFPFSISLLFWSRLSTLLLGNFFLSPSGLSIRRSERVKGGGGGSEIGKEDIRSESESEHNRYTHVVIAVAVYLSED